MRPNGPLSATHIIDGVARCAETGRDEETPAEFRTAVYQRLTAIGAEGCGTMLLDAGQREAALRSAYAKLGVQSRVQLTNALRERGELN
jgi:hypothetical protein